MSYTVFRQDLPTRIRVDPKDIGLLLLTDANLRSVAGLVAGEPVRGSWWGHARGRRSLKSVTNSPTILTFTSVKLVKNKVTFVHRRLWPALVAVGISRADWQLERLSRAALSFLERVEREGPVRSDRVKGVRGGSRKVGELVRDLEKRLLLHSEPVHTESGAHAKSLESWGQWAARVDLGGTMTSAKEGKTVLGTAARALCGRSSAAPRLPWNAEDAR